ncbi:MAG: carboxypeptidase-like regulatory domain-containing protein [Vicinamibacterales bacterium]
MASESWRSYVLAVLLTVPAACGGPTPPTSPRAYGDGLLEGVLTRTQEGLPVGNAVVQVGSRQTVSDPSGRFRFDDLLETGRAPVTFSADGYVTRESTLSLERERRGLAVDLIPSGPPFNVGVYRGMVHDGLESPNRLVPLRRWTMAPSFFFKTTQEPSGSEVPPAILDRIEALFRHAVPEITNGQFQVAAFARGPEAPPPATGWVIVRFVQSLGGTIIGQASVGGNAGTMALVYDPDDPRLFAPDYPSGCYARAVQVSEHELFHTMGFWHTSVAFEGPFADPGCDGIDLNPILTYHSAIAYARRPGHLYPDSDPPSFLLASTGGPPPVVECREGRQALEVSGTQGPSGP